MIFTVMHNIRYILKRGKNGRSRELVLQEYTGGLWLDVPTILEEESEEWEQNNSLNHD